jgi:ketosteroid isomerase-like protein
VQELLDPGVVWTAIEEAPDAGTYRGHEGVRRYWLDWLGDFDIHPFRIEESIEAGDRLVCMQRATTTGKGSGVKSELQYACVYTFGDEERIVEVTEYATRKEALDAVGVREPGNPLSRQ